MIYAVGLTATLAISLISFVSTQAILASDIANGGVYTASVVNDQTKLRFTLSIDTLSLNRGGHILIQVVEQNILALPNSVKSAQNWPVKGLIAANCGIMNYPVGFGIYKGYHTGNNLPSLDRLTLYNPEGGWLCGLILSGVPFYAFAPSSYNATIDPNCTNRTYCFSIDVDPTGWFNGSWTRGIPILFPDVSFHLFSPGIYTAVGGDEWGDLLILHFVVR